MLSQVKPALPTGHTLTVRESAIIAERSQSWIRDRINAGGLRAARRERRLMVDAASLERLLARLASRRSAATPHEPRHLRLVVDNSARGN